MMCLRKFWMFSFKNKIMTKVTFGRETIPFDTKEEWEDFGEI